VVSGTILAAEEESCTLPEVGTVETADVSTATRAGVVISILVMVLAAVGDVVVVGAVVTRTLNTKHKTCLSKNAPDRMRHI
jgi:hypothetical protein